ncbi:MAG: hypothetical protein ACJ788_24470 [Ktedonobacteraceae bacterium]
MVSITFYPTVSRGEAGKYLDGSTSRVLLTASSYAADEVKKYGIVRKKIVTPTLPASITDRAADCGGFVATFKWGGVYPYTAEQYVEWLHAWKPQWAACMDYCCENEITTGQPGIVRERQDKTTEMAYHFWNIYRDASWAWVPTIQGWHVADYERHALEMKPLITEMYAHYGPQSAFRVGIGTLCARASAKTIQEVVGMVSRTLPGIPLHLWGVKLSVMKSPLMLPKQVASVDSAAWNGMFKTGRENWKQSGLPQRQYCFEVALPAYEAKIREALFQPKQPALLEVSA